jgi:hypothetical protein
MSRRRNSLALLCLLGVTGGAGGEEKAAPVEPAPGKEAAKARAAGGRARPGVPSREVAKRADQVEKASEALRAIERQLRELEVTAVERQRTATERLEALAREREVLERSTAVLTQHLAAVEKDLAARKAKATKDEAEAAKLANQSGQIVEAARKFLARVEKHVTEGLPWQLETRKGAIAEARDALAAPGTTPRQALAVAGRIQEAEESLGRLIEPGTVVLEVAGEKRAVPAFRLGLLALAYASEDGALLGYVHSGQKIEEGKIETGAGQETEKQGEAAARVADGYQTALAILQRSLSPRLVDLYLPTLPASEERR